MSVPKLLFCYKLSGFICLLFITTSETQNYGTDVTEITYMKGIILTVFSFFHQIILWALYFGTLSHYILHLGLGYAISSHIRCLSSFNGLSSSKYCPQSFPIGSDVMVLISFCCISVYIHKVNSCPTCNILV